MLFLIHDKSKLAWANFSYDVEQNFDNIASPWITLKGMVGKTLILVSMFVISVCSSNILTNVCVALAPDDTVKHVKNKTSKREQEHCKQNLYEDAVWKNMECFDWC